MARVSIGLPIWNGEKYLAEALDSILAQSFEEFEVLIADNASTDATAEIAADYCGRDRRITYHRQTSNLGAAANFNYVFHHTSGEYFRWAAYDDTWREGQAEYSCGAPPSPPTPIRGFGRVWCTQAGVRDGLGWAKEAEHLIGAQVQSFTNGMILGTGWRTWVLFYDGSMAYRDK